MYIHGGMGLVRYMESFHTFTTIIYGRGKEGKILLNLFSSFIIFKVFLFHMEHFELGYFFQLFISIFIFSFIFIFAFCLLPCSWPHPFPISHFPGKNIHTLMRIYIFDSNSSVPDTIVCPCEFVGI